MVSLFYLPSKDKLFALTFLLTSACICCSVVLKLSLRMFRLLLHKLCVFENEVSSFFAFLVCFLLWKSAHSNIHWCILFLIKALMWKIFAVGTEDSFHTRNREAEVLALSYPQENLLTKTDRHVLVKKVVDYCAGSFNSKYRKIM